MSRRRWASQDDWETTPGGLIVPAPRTRLIKRFIGWMGAAKCCCAPSGCSNYGPFVGTQPSSILLDVSGVVDDVCNKCAWMNGTWEIPWWSQSISGTECYVYYTQVISDEDSDRDTCCEPGDAYSMSVSFAIQGSSGIRYIAAGIQENCALNPSIDQVHYKLQESVTTQYPNTSGTIWTLPFDYDLDCDGSDAVVTVEIP